MQVAADLHLHSLYAGGVSKEMTVENIALWAQRKGMDLLATGDGLHADWLNELERALCEAEPGLYALRPGLEDAIARRLPATLRRPVRFVVSTEVCCAPPGTPALGGLHHLIYFSSLGSARRFRERIARHGDFSDGRPLLTLNSRQLLDAVLEHGEDSHFAPAHIFNPWYSSLGTVAGKTSLQQLFGGLASHVLAVETGLTSTPPMCRRVSCLDKHALFSCSDAHRLQNIGRECTILEIELSYSSVMTALRSGAGREVTRTLKFPLERTRYYRNRCSACEDSFDGTRCPYCGRTLVMGSRDRLEIVADRGEPLLATDAPPFCELLPLAHVLSGLLQVGIESKAVERFYFRLIENLGHERFVLTEAAYDSIARLSTPQVARAIVGQRTGASAPQRSSAEQTSPPAENQLSLGLG